MERKYKRTGDEIMEQMQSDIKEILKILNPSNGNLGVVAQVEVNKNDIEGIKKRPSNIKNILVAIAIIINTVVASIALIGGIK